MKLTLSPNAWGYISGLYIDALSEKGERGLPVSIEEAAVMQAFHAASFDPDDHVYSLSLSRPGMSFVAREVRSVLDVIQSLPDMGHDDCRHEIGECQELLVMELEGILLHLEG